MIYNTYDKYHIHKLTQFAVRLYSVYVNFYCGIFSNFSMYMFDDYVGILFLKAFSPVLKNSLCTCGE